MTRLQAGKLQEELFGTTQFEWEDESGKHYFEYRPNLCDICINARHSINGASDPWSDEELIKTGKMLELTEKTWTDNKDLIDALIHTMVWYTVKMIEKELLRRRTGA